MLATGRSGGGIVGYAKTLPLIKDGEFARTLSRSREAALALYRHLQQSKYFATAFAPQLDIVVFAPRASSATESSALARQIFDAAARHDLHLAVAELPCKFWAATHGAMELDRETITCLRSVLMKPEHLEWVDRIWERLEIATKEVFEEGAQPH